MDSTTGGQFASPQFSSRMGVEAAGWLSLVIDVFQVTHSNS